MNNTLECTKKLLDSIYAKHGNINPDDIIKICHVMKFDIYSMVRTMCAYINLTKRVENTGEFEVIRDHILKNEDLSKRLQESHEQYRKILHENDVLSSRCALAQEKQRNQEIEYKLLHDKYKILAEANEILELVK